MTKTSLQRWDMHRTIFPPTLDKCSNVLFILSYMKGVSTGPWAMQKINSILYPANLEEVTWAGFILELDKMFVYPNHQATAQRKLTTLHQGDSSVEELIQEFEIHGPISGLGDVGLVDRFEQAIPPPLQESIYQLKPMPTTWAEWKHKPSLLNNQWRWFRDTQPKAATTKPSLFHSPPVITSTAAASSSSSSFSRPSTTTVPPPPQPMDLDC